MINVSLNDETHTYTVIRNGDLIAMFPDGHAAYVARVINALVANAPKSDYLFISPGRVKGVAFIIVDILDAEYGICANVDEGEG